MVNYQEFMSNPQYEAKRGDLDYLANAQRILGRLHLMYSSLDPDFVESVMNGSENYAGETFRFSDSQVEQAFMDAYAMIQMNEATPEAARARYDPRILRGSTLQAVLRLESARRSASDAISSGLYDQMSTGQSALDEVIQGAIAALYSGIASSFTEDLIRAGLNSRDVPALVSEHNKRRNQPQGSA